MHDKGKADKGNREQKKKPKLTQEGEKKAEAREK